MRILFCESVFMGQAKHRPRGREHSHILAVRPEKYLSLPTRETRRALRV